MPPRNSRLSAYYNLPPSPSPKSVPQLPKTREEALIHAENLTKTLPLQELLTHATTQKSRSEALSKQLHTATLSHYQHLQSALQTAQDVQSVCKSLKPSTESVTKAIDLSRAISQHLAETRALVTSLEATRRVEQLVAAANILTTHFPKLADQLPLCTDPDNLRAEIKVSSQRFVSIRPAVGQLAAVDKSLKPAIESLDAAAGQLSHALKSEQSVMNRGDVAAVRLLLQDDRTAVENDFVTCVVDNVMHKRVSEKALTGTPVERSVILVNFFVDHVFDTLMRDVDVYQSLFGDCSWVSQVVHDALAEVTQGIRGVIDDVGGVRKLRDALKRLDEMGDIGRSAAKRVDSVVRDIALAEAGGKVRVLVNDVQGLEKMEVEARVKELQEKVVDVLGWDQDEVERLFGRVMTQSVGVQETALSAGLCQLLIDEGWSLVRVRDICVERCVEGVLQQFRRDLNGADGFVDNVTCVDEVGRRFAVEGLVDDDLGEGFGYRVLKGVVEIVRERGLNLVEVARVEDILGRVVILDATVWKGVVEERSFGE